MTTATQQKTKAKKNTGTLTREGMEREMMIERETDQWMTEHYKTRA